MSREYWTVCLDCRKQQSHRAAVADDMDESEKPCGACGGELYFLSRPLALPGALGLSDMFVEWARHSFDRGTKAPEGYATTFQAIDPFEPLFSKRKLKTPTIHNVPVEAFCGVQRAPHSLWVKALPSTVELVRAGYLGDASRDRVNFQITIRDDGKALVTWHNSLTCSDRWLAVIDSAEILAVCGREEEAS